MHSVVIRVGAANYSYIMHMCTVHLQNCACVCMCVRVLNVLNFFPGFVCLSSRQKTYDKTSKHSRVWLTISDLTMAQPFRIALKVPLSGAILRAVVSLTLYYASPLCLLWVVDEFTRPLILVQPASYTSDKIVGPIQACIGYLFP